jgi:plastocyanin
LRRAFLRWLSVACTAIVAGCGDGGDDSPLNPTPGDQVATTTIVITSAGVNPRHIIVPSGSRVTFTNSDSRNHNMASTPHPAHTDCPALNAVNLLAPGQSKQSDPLNSPGLCGFHDHDLDESRTLQGTVTVQ